MIAATLSVYTTLGALGNCLARIATIVHMTLEELERDYVSLRQQSEAVRSYL